MVEPSGLVLGRAKEGVAYLVGVGIRAEVKGLGLGYGYGLGSRSRVQGTRLGPGWKASRTNCSSSSSFGPSSSALSPEYLHT